MLFLMPLQAKESIPGFTEIAPGVEYRQVLLEEPRSLLVLQLRCDPKKAGFRLLLAKDGGHKPTATAAEMLDRHDLLAVINSSYFGHRDEILGYAQRSGEVLNPEVSKDGLLTAFFGWDGGRAFLKRRGEPLPKDVPVLFQSGPRLVWDSTAVEGLEPTRLANRTVLALDSRGRVCFVVIGGFSQTTLSELPALLLRSAEQGGVGAARAVNLDGGKSTQFCFLEKGRKRDFPGFVKVPVFLGVSKPQAR